MSFHELELDLADDLIDYTLAAALVDLPEATVRQWKFRGLLPVAGQGERGRPLFRPLDVLRAEARTRATPGGRKRGAAA